MFENKFQQQTPAQDKNISEMPESKKVLTYENFEIAVIAVAVAVLGVSAFFYFTGRKHQVNNNNQSIASTSSQTGTGGRLPGVYMGDEFGTLTGTSSEIRAESLSFVDFYKPEEDEFISKEEKFKLPMNVKSEVLNYFDFSRKVSIDKKVDQLNRNGFVIIDNPFSGSGDNFPGLYQALLQKDVPILITDDFLIYYYQNNLKNIYKEIEKNVFYNDIWEISNYLFNIANSRYRDEYNKVGLTNDPVLESKRKEAAYFATVLELLKPKDQQVSIVAGDTKKFSDKEAKIYEFTLPVYLEEDVNREAEFIFKGEGKAKSPVFLYTMDYGRFAVPEEYQANAKLYNYYLALMWINSEFPLYYQSDDCPHCLLDKNDWRINLAAASYIAKDFSDNQEIKNKWAKIYKIYSYFSGLRSDLTYLDYNNALSDSFGKNYKIEQIFSSGNKSLEADLAKLQEKLASRGFSEIEGGINRDDPETKPLIGFKLLQDSYWPDDYIFKALTAPNVGQYRGEAKEASRLNIVGCKDKKEVLTRCRGIALDAVNLIYDIPSENAYFRINSNYDNYQERSDLLKDQIAKFDTGTWHNGNYWSTLNIAKLLLSEGDERRTILNNNPEWQDKNLNTALGAFVNLQLQADQLIGGSGEDNKLNAYIGDYNRVEPDLTVINELLATSKMLREAFLAFGVINEKDFIYGKLSDLSSDLATIKNIALKEKEGKAINGDDKLYIYHFVKKIAVGVQSSKIFKMDFFGGIIFNKIEGVKMLIYIYQQDGKKIMTAGPVFNYQESKK